MARTNPKPRTSPPALAPEPRWPALIAALAVGGLYLSLHSELVVGPRWLLPAIIVMLLVPTELAHQRGRQHLNRALGFTTTSVLTIAMVLSVALLVTSLPSHQLKPTDLLLSAASLWFTNVLVFALWYWRLDAGGPYGREAQPGHAEGSFLFPQMTMPPDLPIPGRQEWSPNFFDYLFLAFTTSTAFSPTDTPVLDRWAKLLMMVQAIISLTVLAVLAARAVNIL